MRGSTCDADIAQEIEEPCLVDSLGFGLLAAVIEGIEKPWHLETGGVVVLKGGESHTQSIASVSRGVDAEVEGTLFNPAETACKDFVRVAAREGIVLSAPDGEPTGLKQTRHAIPRLLKTAKHRA
jgi:hypothetical protein